MIIFILKSPVFLIKRYAVTITVLSGRFGIFVPVFIFVVNFVAVFPVISNSVFIFIMRNGNVFVTIFSFTFVPLASHINPCF
ncbi:hypothetical protein ES705_48597 [subsurface metagenome]